MAVLPGWLRPLSALSPATYALSASRKLVGIGLPASGQGHLDGAPLSAVMPDLAMLVLMGAVMIPLGLWVFKMAEQWAKRAGKLKRTG